MPDEKDSKKDSISYFISFVHIDRFIRSNQIADECNYIDEVFEEDVSNVAQDMLTAINVKL